MMFKTKKLCERDEELTNQIFILNGLTQTYGLYHSLYLVLLRCVPGHTRNNCLADLDILLVQVVGGPGILPMFA